METKTNEEKNILVKNFNNLYVICASKKESVNKNCKLIYTKDKREMELIIAVLGTNVSVYEPDIQSEEISDWLRNKTYKDIMPSVQLTGRENDEMMRCFSKIGVHPLIKEKLDSEAYKGRLNKEYVHKISEKNVMLSDFVEIDGTGLLHLNVFFETNEIILDHDAEDHIEAILLTEICRQAGIVAASVNQDPTRAFIIVKEERVYKRFVKRSDPTIIQVLCVAPKKGSGYCIFSLMQEDSCCLKGCLIGKSFPNKQAYIEKITE